MARISDQSRDRPNVRPSFCIIMPFHIAEGRGGGAEVQAWFLACELARRGYRTAYVAQSVRGKQGTVETVEGVSIHWVRNAHRFRWSNAGAYYRALSRVDAEIVVQRMTAFTTAVAAFWCWRRRRKFVWICSDNTAPRKWVFLRSQRAANRAQRVGWLKGAVFLLDALITDVGRNWGMSRVSQAFTQNDVQRELLAREFGLQSQRMISGHPAPERIVPARERLAHPLVLWAGNLGANKRPEKFIELAWLARDTPLEFIMIGSHFDSTRVGRIFANLPPNLKWPGKVPFEKALALFDQAAFFVNTSELEGFPNTFIQAWQRGVPVLTLGVDPDEIIKSNGLGLVDADLGALLRYMQAMLSDPASYEATATNARRCAEEHLSTKAMCDNFIIQLAKGLG